MMEANKVLLASHGTDGATAAEHMAIDVCNKGGSIHHLFVVPDFWQGMTGDDWLNNGATRNRFRNYLESALGIEVDSHIDRLRRIVENAGIIYSPTVVVGKPDGCLISASHEEHYDLVVMGSPRPKGTAGLRSRMSTRKLVQSLTSPLMIAPYPDV